MPSALKIDITHHAGPWGALKGPESRRFDVPASNSPARLESFVASQLRVTKMRLSIMSLKRLVSKFQQTFGSA